MLTFVNNFVFYIVVIDIPLNRGIIFEKLQIFLADDCACLTSISLFSLCVYSLSSLPSIYSLSPYLMVAPILQCLFAEASTIFEQTAMLRNDHAKCQFYSPP